MCGLQLDLNSSVIRKFHQNRQKPGNSKDWITAILQIHPVKCDLLPIPRVFEGIKIYYRPLLY